jgi:general stress protein 26
MSKDLSRRAKAIIQEIRYLTIASVTPEGKPWNSPVFGGFDQDYNFYFGTHKNSQKAKNVAANNNVFVAIYNSTLPPGTGKGVYIQGVATLLTDIDEIKRVYNLLKARHDNHFWEFEALDGTGPINLYKIAPLQAWMNDDGREDGFYVDIRTAVDLA